MSNPYAVGAKLSLPAKTITQEHINLYAHASDDMNPLHIDPKFAATTMFHGTIAHGLMSMAFLNELLMKNFGQHWSSTGEISVTFLAPVKPNDVITTLGEITNVDDASGKIEIKLECKNQRDVAVVIGKAFVIIK